MQDLFGLKPSIRNAVDLEAATQLLARYRERQQRIDAELEQELQAVRDRFERRGVLRVDNQRVPLKARIAALQQAVSRYADKHRAQLFEPGRKTCQLGGRQLQLRDEAPRIDFIAGQNRRTVAAALAAVEGFQAALARLLKRFGLAGWIVLVPDLDWDGLKRGLASGEIDPQEVADYGMIYKSAANIRLLK